MVFPSLLCLGRLPAGFCAVVGLKLGDTPIALAAAGERGLIGLIDRELLSLGLWKLLGLPSGRRELAEGLARSALTDRLAGSFSYLPLAQSVGTLMPRPCTSEIRELGRSDRAEGMEPAERFSIIYIHSNETTTTSLRFSLSWGLVQATVLLISLASGSNNMDTEGELSKLAARYLRREDEEGPAAPQELEQWHQILRKHPKDRTQVQVQLLTHFTSHSKFFAELAASEGPAAVHSSLQYLSLLLLPPGQVTSI